MEYWDGLHQLLRKIKFWIDIQRERLEVLGVGVEDQIVLEGRSVIQFHVDKICGGVGWSEHRQRLLKSRI